MHPTATHTRRPLLTASFVVVTVGALALVFLPIGWQINRFIVWLYYTGLRVGVPDFVKIPWYEFGLNMLLFAVPTLLAALLWPRVSWWVWPVLALCTSGAIELVQLAFLPREFSFADIAANTLGAATSASLLVWFKRSRAPE